MSIKTIDSLRNWLQNHDLDLSLVALDTLNSSEREKLAKYLGDKGLKTFENQEDQQIFTALLQKARPAATLQHKTN